MTMRRLRKSRWNRPFRVFAADKSFGEGLAIESQPKERSRPVRVLSPPGVAVAWRSGSKQGACFLGDVGLGGLFLKTPHPLAVGSTLELLFDVSTGNEVRARGTVRHVKPGRGMGVKFVHMAAEHRSRLNQFLKIQLESGDSARVADSKGVAEAPARVVSEAGSAPCAKPCVELPAVGSAAIPSVTRAATADVQPDSSISGEETPIRGSRTATEQAVSEEEELKLYVSMAERSNYYELLGVTAESSKDQIKQKFYALARKFHPDRHASRSEWAESLQKLMGAANQAYDVLSDDQKRAEYDQRQALSQRETAEDEAIRENLRLAAACRRDNNFAGSVVWMRKCVALEPSVAKYLVLLAISLAGAGHHQHEAIEHFQKAIEIDPWNVPAYLHFGKLYEQMRLPWRARPLYSKILEIDPEHTGAKEHLARLDARDEKKSSRRKFATRFKKGSRS
jgi:tetratricopeptide (TPR) repeat protein